MVTDMQNYPQLNLLGRAIAYTRYSISRAKTRTAAVYKLKWRVK